ncbi:MAG: AMP-binding protein [Bacteroidetes bacterium]|nr:AMP-binding protein [Bacteroidota bacterium]
MQTSLADLLRAFHQQFEPDLPPAILTVAHAALVERDGVQIPDADIRNMLSVAASPRFLRALSREQRYGAYERAMRAAMLHLRYSLGDMLDDRARTFPERCFLEEGDGERRSLSLAQTATRCGIIAHALRAGMPSAGAPRVALFTANTLEGALCDLACLAHGIFVTPLSVHLDEPALAAILLRLRITTVLIDDEDRLRRILHVRKEYDLKLTVLFAGVGDPEEKGVERFDSFIANNRERALRNGTDVRRTGIPGTRDMVDYTGTSTVMFTSGSTGRPKGICFSQLNMVSKRFARAAALPDVGIDETLVAFLPLFHTFGRFLELQGMLFWGGRYVFAGNPSREALFARMREFRPTGLVSIPQRWGELREEAERAGGLAAVSGGRLRWGLSAAGYLAPSVFRYFHQQGVALCSGFGMTEATGGILMTPPGEYEDDSVGIPLPGIEVRLSTEGELEMRGPYVARALPELEDGRDTDAMGEEAESLEAAAALETDPAGEWEATGDLFTRSADGHYRIIDRVKDIYKNSRGQTVAPLAIENRFRDVPGLRRCFLSGDGRPHNTLLIVLDQDASMLRGMPSAQEKERYFNEIVRAVNHDLPAYERILEFTVLNKDFSESTGELTAKGSLNRKRIAEQYRAEIDRMYRARALSFQIAGLRLQLPLWILRDIGCTERDLRIHPDGLFNAAAHTLLRVAEGRSEQRWRIGDFEYQLSGATIDLGRLCRQPAGWTGNAALADFFPCHEGWDVPLPEVIDVHPLQTTESAAHPETPWKKSKARADAADDGMRPGAAEYSRGSVGSVLLQLHQLLALIFAAESPAALQLFDDIAAALQSTPHRHAALLRRRLGSCAWHPDEAVRIRAYEALLLFDPDPEDAAPYHAFMNAGRTFLDGPALERIASPDMRGERLAALRRRLQSYRAQRPLPSAEDQRVYSHLLALMYRLASRDPACVYDVRAEFALWMQVDAMRAYATELFYALKDVYVRRQRGLSADSSGMPARMDRALDFMPSVKEESRRRVRNLFVTTPFLSLTLLMLHGIDNLQEGDLAEGSLRVEALPAHRGEAAPFRIVLQTRAGRRYAFLLLLDDRYREPAMPETLLSLLRIAGVPVRLPSLPRFGSFMPEAGAISFGEAPGRLLSTLMDHGRHDVDTAELRRWWVSALSAWIRGWRDSGRLLIPGAIEAENVIVPWIRYREGAVIASVAGWHVCEGPHCLIEGLFNVLHRGAERWNESRLQSTWVIDALYEVLGDDDARALLQAMADEQLAEAEPIGMQSADVILRAVHLRARQYCPPVAVQNAVACWKEWAGLYPRLVEDRGEEYLRHVLGLYGVSRYGDAARWFVTRHTLLAGLPPDCGTRLEELIFRMNADASWTVTRSIELAELQERIPPGILREQFLRMVFPAQRGKELQLVRMRVAGKDAVVVEHAVHKDERHDMVIRETMSAAETGGILSLLMRERFPVPTGEELRYLALFDGQRRIMGGVVYAAPDDAEAELKAIVVEETVRGQGLGRALIGDLALRMKTAGARSLRAPHYLLPFCVHAGFASDPRDGELRHLLDEQPDED